MAITKKGKLDEEEEPSRIMIITALPNELRRKYLSSLLPSKSLQNPFYSQRNAIIGS